MRKMWYCILVLICVLKGGGTVRRKRRIMSGLLALCIALSVLPLSACTAPKLTLDPEELYALPELPERYTALNKQLSAIQESGAEYAAPVSGSNIQPVQMMDLDGDGREEALAFFRQSDGEKPLKIHIFTADDDNSYRQAAVIERFTAWITAILTATAVWRSSWAGGSAWICRRWLSTPWSRTAHGS